MTNVPTKSEEIEQLDDIIDALDDGYLRSILTHARPMIETAIRNDFGFIDLEAQWAAIDAERQELASLRRQTLEARQELARMNQEKSRILAELADLRSSAAIVADRLAKYR